VALLKLGRLVSDYHVLNNVYDADFLRSADPRGDSHINRL
jgi:hypothetical protein